MRIPRKLLGIAAVIMLSALFSSCSENSSHIKMEDGYYTAEAAAFDSYGWKEYVTIYVSDDKIRTVEYDAFNASGFVKSWDIDYMRLMNTAMGTYPNEFTRIYAVSLINWQNSTDIDAVAGATSSHVKFKILAEAALERARLGDKEVALVELSEEE